MCIGDGGCMQARASRSGRGRYGSGEGAHELESLVDPARMRAFADLRLAPIADLWFTTSVGPHPKVAHGEDEQHAGSGGSKRACLGRMRPKGAQGKARAGTGPGVGVAASPSLMLSAVDVLRVWLESDRSMEMTARQFGVHRHTAGRYLRRIGEALSADLADPQTLAELWYACRFTRFGEREGGSRR